MKQVLSQIATLTLVLALAAGCSSAPLQQSESGGAAAGSDAASVASTEPGEPASTEPSDPPESDGLPMSIGFITQEYEGDNIAEIPYIEYDGDRNDEIEAINRSLNQGIKQVYDTFMSASGDDGREWIEIKSYPFTTEQYLQVVVTTAVFPGYGTDGDLFSINCDRETGHWISIEEMLKTEGVSEDDIFYRVGELFEPEVPTQSIEEIKISGFLIRQSAQGEAFVEYLLEITVANSESEPWKSFYSYTPQFDQLFQMNAPCLFDPSDLDVMDPPLSYQQVESQA